MTKFTIFLIVVTMTRSAIAGPLDNSEVASDAKWVVHLDLEALRKTEFGSGLQEGFDRGRLSIIEGKIKMETGIDFEFDELKSLTAYGRDLQGNPERDAVLLIHADHNWKDSLDRIVTKTAGPEDGEKKVTREMDSGGRELYSANGDVFGAVPKDGLLALSHEKASFSRARDVIAGKLENLDQKKVASGFEDINAPIFLMVTAEGLKDLKVPPQTRIFQQAEGGRLVVGESDELLFLNLALKTSDDTVRGQIAAIINGLVAVGQLAQQKDPDLNRILRSVKVSQGSDTVSVQVDFPATKALERIRTELGN